MAKFIMVQGTTSDAGKSFVVTGLCRLFSNMGLKVAPFKAQNLTSNGYVTSEGLETGKAQVLQAEAARVEPSCKMNPILVKPQGGGVLKVLAMGKEWVSPDGRSYKEHREFFGPLLAGVLEDLDRNFDVVVIEGAGSPVEINIKDLDLVNMYIAKMVNSPVILVGDIERGGVFASLVGTMALLDDEEKDLVKGLVINKFRGKADSLESGIKKLEEITEKKVIGIVPHLDVDLEPEDSLSAKSYKRPSNLAGGEGFDGERDMAYSSSYRNQQYEALAAAMKESLDIEYIMNVMGL